MAAAGTVLALGLTGCGGSSASHPSTTTVTSTATLATHSTTASTPSSTASTTTASSTAATTMSSQAVAGVVACDGSDTAISFGTGGDAGMEHSGLVLVFRNRGARSCELTGYPGAAFVSAGGHQLQVPRSLNGYLGGLKPGTRIAAVRLAPGQSASALLEGTDIGNDDATCPHYVALLVTAPNETATDRFARSWSLCGPTIHPVVAGTTGSSPGE